MSYNTDYTLSAVPDPALSMQGLEGYGVNYKVIHERIDLISEGEPLAISERTGVIISIDECSWHDHETHMKLLSEQLPALVFTLKGEGQEPGDLWKKYFFQGKMQEAKAEITFAAYDPKELR